MADPAGGLLGGRYRLLGRLDQAGGPWRARDELLHRDVAISEVPLPPSGPERERVLATVRAAAGLRHPAIVTIHDVLIATDRIWVVCELVTGRTLSQTLRAEGPQTAERVADIGLRVFDALTAAKSAGVTHGGLTPDAVVLAPDGRIAVSGFATTGSHGDDMRGLGSMLYTALAGHPPGGHGTPVAMDGTPLIDPTRSGSYIPEGPLAPLLAALLGDDPSLRPDDASVRLTLLRLAPRRRLIRRAALVSGGAAATALVVAAGVLLWPSIRAEPVPAPSPTATPIVLPTYFVAVPENCDYLTREQAREMGLKVNPSRTLGDCSWSSADLQPANQRFTLRVQFRRYIARYGDTALERARVNFVKFFREETARKKTGVGLPVRHVVPPRIYDGPGEQTYVTEMTNELTYSTDLVYRVANVLVSVQYTRQGPADPDRRTVAGSVKIAEWVLRALAEG
ncbi:protein kinase [Spongiactinospora sp. TRM90649]|uniref:protein kinase n=1 Tax=Spongiactinospora sp. TRM90649 TaxID=3031114 RepID=UPI0023F88019|nr:protein kinase [Spongiactinospora sp. TRM90649]MDF5751037.1 protein kinase [Spongiactinospora sp. TRM90649]